MRDAMLIADYMSLRPSATYAGDDLLTHVDVVAADADHNPMLASLVPFLTDITQR